VETLDHLAGSWRIYQLKGGHRFSADDVLTAWTATRQRPAASRVLDLGSGIGSVGLLCLYRLPAATLLGLEVQELSWALARRTAAFNELEARAEFRRGDLRDPGALHDAGRFPLVTGSPPYFPPGAATVSPHPQRAAARVELHGDVFDYCRRAAEHLEDDGLFVFVHAANDARPEQAVEAAGLRLVERQDVYFRRSQAPTVALFSCGWRGERRIVEPFVIRAEDGRWTQEYLAMREEMGTTGLRR
jgi:tRNA1Val (adenine37-N6)-methyltransferase